MKAIPTAGLCLMDANNGLPQKLNTKRRTLKKRRLYIFRNKNRGYDDDEKRRKNMIAGILTGILLLVLGVIGVKYGVAAIIAGITALAAAIGLRKD